MQIEQFTAIKGAEGYIISNYGRIIGLTGKQYKTPCNKKGYPLLRIPNRNYCKMVHRVVAEHFIGIQKDMQVNHIDGNKLNNNISNLEYITCKENINHAINLGLRTRISNLKSKAMFDDAQLFAIREAIKLGYKNTEIAKYFKCNHSTISKIRTNKNYIVNG